MKYNMKCTYMIVYTSIYMYMKIHIRVTVFVQAVKQYKGQGSRTAHTDLSICGGKLFHCRDCCRILDCAPKK